MCRTAKLVFLRIIRVLYLHREHNIRLEPGPLLGIIP